MFAVKGMPGGLLMHTTSRTPEGGICSCRPSLEANAEINFRDLPKSCLPVRNTQTDLLHFGAPLARLNGTSPQEHKSTSRESEVRSQESRVGSRKSQGIRRKA